MIHTSQIKKLHKGNLRILRKAKIQARQLAGAWPNQENDKWNYQAYISGHFAKAIKVIINNIVNFESNLITKNIVSGTQIT